MPALAPDSELIAVDQRRGQGVVLPDTGHWVAEEWPKHLLAALTPFLAPVRDATATAVAASRP